MCQSSMRACTVVLILKFRQVSPGRGGNTGAPGFVNRFIFLFWWAGFVRDYSIEKHSCEKLQHIQVHHSQDRDDDADL